MSALRATGRPWAALADLVSIIKSSEQDLERLARELLYPDDDLRWRLFHLACLGLMLRELSRSGCSVVSLRPIGFAGGPTFKVTDSQSRRWDLWFEAGAMWSYYGVPSPYVEATRRLPGSGQPIGADLVLLRRGGHGVVVECKYSTSQTYVARNGYLQAVTYLAEMQTGLTSTGEAIVVGPDEVVPTPSTAHTVVGPVSIGPPSALRRAVSSAMNT